jgi:exonuclease III
MATILFWNINKKRLFEEIIFLCNENAVDILILAEAKPDISDPEVLIALNSGRENVYIAPFNPSTRLSFFFRYPPESIEFVADEGGIAIRRISPPIGLDIILVALHLPSKLRMKEDDQKFQAVRVSELIQKAESNVGHARTIVIGDLNMNHFEVGVVSADGLHAVLTQTIARKGSRKVQGRNKPFFYNPMWGRMGDSSAGAPGTYYYGGSSYVSYFWNTFDQVLLRPDLLDFFLHNDLKVISKIGDNNLMTENGISSSYSDHLPIVVTLQIERMTQNDQ